MKKIKNNQQNILTSKGFWLTLNSECLFKHIRQYGTYNNKCMKETFLITKRKSPL